MRCNSVPIAVVSASDVRCGDRRPDYRERLGARAAVGMGQQVGNAAAAAAVAEGPQTNSTAAAAAEQLLSLESDGHRRERERNPEPTNQPKRSAERNIDLSAAILLSSVWEYGNK